MSGLFISVEGGEGVGKTSFSKLLAEDLRSRQYDVFLTREPGGTALALKIRELFLHPPEGEALDPLTELLLVSAARTQHVKGPIASTLAKPRGLVLCDRFYDSTRVYQGLIGGNDEATLEHIVRISIGQYEPVITFLLDCPTQVSMMRTGKREQANSQDMNRFDAGTTAFHERLRKAYLKVAAAFHQRIVVLDSDHPTEALVEQALLHLEKRSLLL